MNNSDLAASIERLMAKVDYYLHCELDDEYEHDQPQSARVQLEVALRHELLRASAIGVVSSITANSRVLSDRDDLIA
ncbi:hypothetical protein [Variovorax sp. LT1R16]|uniref:hypothetical protein n=1 Tax=Variovorax sp. LT1R16 TaxID=3443728 RepID=UPI003F44ECE9